MAVANQPTLSAVTPNHGPAGGGSFVTLTGTLFEEGATVLFGTALAGDVVVMSANQITCTTPPHYAALVDVTVQNVDNTESVLTHGYQFEAQGVVVSLPNVSGDFGTHVDVGLSAANIDGLRAADIEITFDPAVLSVQGYGTGTLTPAWSVAGNTDTPGHLILSLANATSVTGSGTLAGITFEVIGSPPAATALGIDSVQLNDGAIACTTQAGLFTVNGFYALTGTINYFGGTIVPETILTLAGTGSHSAVSDEAGGFAFADIPTGSYTLAPSKADGAAEITAYDASLILQAAAELLTLSEAEILAADVNKNGLVTSMDAAYVLEHAVGLSEVPFPGAGRIWDFIPAQRSYSLINSNLTAQDFTGILIGDVSGNWTPASAAVQGDGDGPADNGENTLFLPVVDVLAGGIITVPLSLELGQGDVSSLDVRIGYDPDVVSVVSVEKGDLVSDWLLGSNISVPGQIRVGVAGTSALASGGELLKITFQATGDEGSVTDLTIQQGDLNENEIPAALQNGTLYVGNDSDGDGLFNRIEAAGCTDPQDADTDDDGISDGVEDDNHNGQVDPDETDPCKIDTDEDGIQDGTELGVTGPVADPDGDGPLKGTDTTVFVPDADPDSTTNPTTANSDADGIPDGVEDGNHNGMIDAWETDPADGASFPAAVVHLKKGFNLIALHAAGQLGDWLPALDAEHIIEKVLAYDALAGKFITLIPGDAAAETYALGGNEGMVVYAKEDKSVGFAMAVCTDLNLAQGFNLVGIGCPPAGYGAFQLLVDLGPENVSSIQRYNQDKGTFETAAFEEDGSVSGVNFLIVSGEGYFVFMKK